MLTDFARRVYDYCAGKGLFAGVSAIVTGLSGGPDSVALLLVLKEFSEEFEGFPKLYAVHVNHGLRECASEDANLASDLCVRLGVPFKLYEFDIAGDSKTLGRGLEETGRIRRYEAFRQEAELLSAGTDEVKIATAHHKGDLTETFLMNLFRGAGLEGLTGMKSGGDVIRPLLCVDKDEILSYLELKGGKYAIDETNSDTDYTRNGWRNIILPEISKVAVKDPKEAVFETSRLLETDADFINREAKKAYEECVIRTGGYTFVETSAVEGLHDAISSRVIRLLWLETFGNLTDFEAVHVRAAMNLIPGDKGTRCSNMPFGRKALAAGGFLGFCGADGSEGLACAFSSRMGFPAALLPEPVKITKDELRTGAKTLKLPYSHLLLKASIVENNESIVYNNFSWFTDRDELVIGGRTEFSKIHKAGSSCETDLKKLLSDLKVPRDARRHLLYVTGEDRILWIPGVAHTEGFISGKSRSKWLEAGHPGQGELINLLVTEEGD